MDRFSIPATILTAITVCAALVGCTVGSSDEYRTFAELEAEKEAQDVASADDETTVPEDADREVVRSDEDQTESIDRPALEPAPSGDASEEELLAMAVIGGVDDTNSPVGAVQSEKPAEPPAKTEATNEWAAAKTAIGDPASNDVSIRQEDGSLVDLSAREIKLLVPEKSFNSEGPQGALRVSYDDLNLLTILNMEPVPPHPEPHFPDWLNALEGRRIRIRGFMYPAFLETGLKGFILVRDNQECCFGPGAKIYDHIEVFMREGVTADYIPGRPFDVVGVLHIRPEADDEELYQLYQIEDAVVVDR